MTDQADHNPSKLRDRIAQALAQGAAGEDAPIEIYRAEVPQWYFEAQSVIDALSLDYDYKITHTPDGKHVSTDYRISGGWTEAGADW